MIVVADTSPINYLILLGYSHVFHETYGRVIIPHAVLNEMEHPRAPAAVRAWASAPPTWLEVYQVAHLDESLTPDLGAGEREAISLALEIDADILLIDERAGRKAAEARHIEVAGTLAVLLQASIRGYFDFAVAISQLRQHGFRISPAVQALMLARYHAASSAQETNPD